MNCFLRRRVWCRQCDMSKVIFFHLRFSFKKLNFRTLFCVACFASNILFFIRFFFFSFFKKFLHSFMRSAFLMFAVNFLALLHTIRKANIPSWFGNKKKDMRKNCISYLPSNRKQYHIPEK